MLDNGGGLGLNDAKLEDWLHVDAEENILRVAKDL